MVVAPKVLAPAVCLVLCAGLIGCDGEDPSDDELVREAEPFVDGVAKDTEGDAFRIVLNSRDGALDVGENLLVVRVGFHDPNAPLEPGIGIPGAKVSMLAWMPLDEGMIEAEVAGQYLGGGRYLLDPIELDRPGVWQLDIGVDVGVTLRENVSFAFVVEE
ncbi:hypothetical protein ACNOYE_37265 [Nannocystaceae bacterium ST9]